MDSFQFLSKPDQGLIQSTFKNTNIINLQMNNSEDDLEASHAAAGVSNAPDLIPIELDHLPAGDDAKAAVDHSQEIAGVKPTLNGHPAGPTLDELDNFEPTPVHLTEEQEAGFRDQAVKYKQLADQLEKNFYEQPQYYVLSARWLKRWKIYVSYDEANHSKPSNKFIGAGTLPPVNLDILDSTADLTFELSEPYDYLDNALKPGLKEHVDYVLISTDMWNIFVDNFEHYNFKRYLTKTRDGKKVEVYFYRVHAIILYNQILKEVEREYLNKFKKVNLQLPQYKPLDKEFMEVVSKKVRYSLKQGSNHMGYADFSKENVKVWAVEDDLTEKQFMNHLTKCCRANTSYNYKIFFPGEFLNVHEKSIEELQLSQTTSIVFELRQEKQEWTFFNKQNLPTGKCDSCRDIKLLTVLCGCNNAIYCTKECKNKDKFSHKYKCDRDAESSEQEKALEITDRSRKGIMGLRNLGNTCFMNSGIQCITSIGALTEYFLTNLYIPDINEQNPIGTKGELSKAYAKQLQKMWYGEEESVAPTVLKRAIGKFQPMFSGYDQHDSGELISYLLDGLHEDLNRVKVKPYTETKDYDGRPDEVVAKESWELFLLRNKSIIVDLMYGQYKSRLQCPKCTKISLTFDPFLMIPLPVPQDDSKIFELRYQKEDHIATVKLEIPYKVNQNLKLSDIANKLATCLSLPNNLLCIGVSYYESILLDMKLDANDVRRDYKHKTIVFRQKDAEEDLVTGVPVNVLQTLCNSLYGNENYRRNIIKPRIFIFDPNTTGKQIHERFFKYWGHLLGIQDYEKDILHATPQNEKWRILLVTKSSYEFCQYCEKNVCYNCALPYSDTVTVKDLLEKCGKFKDKHKLQFEIYWRKGAENVEKTFQKAESVVSYGSKADGGSASAKSHVTIYDCLKLAEQPQTLGEDNAWYCPNCKEFVLATKQMAIYKAPKILIFYFKRFKSKGYFKSKLNTLIDFPINDLDISQFVLNNDLPEGYFTSPADGEKPSTHYSLFAISNHYGGLGGGHYTAYCRKQGSKWYDFDDSSVNPISEDRLVDSASYVLFYRKKD